MLHVIDILFSISQAWLKRACINYYYHSGVQGSVPQLSCRDNTFEHMIYVPSLDPRFNTNLCSIQTTLYM